MKRGGGTVLVEGPGGGLLAQPSFAFAPKRGAGKAPASQVAVGRAMGWEWGRACVPQGWRGPRGAWGWEASPPPGAGEDQTLSPGFFF